MAGGTFKNSVAKVRPGTYVNVINGRPKTFTATQRGVAIIPFVGYDYGPRGTFLKITADSPDKYQAEFGRSIYDDNEFMIMLRMIMANATTCYVYIADGGAQASGSATMGEATMTIKAKYKGSLGNSLKVSCVANPVGGFDVSVYLSGYEVERFEGLKIISDLSGKSSYVDFSGTGELAAFASVTLSGGADATEEGTSKKNITEFLDKVEKIRFNVMAFPITDESLQTALLTKIRYIRENIGWKCQAVAPNFAADYEGIINLTNSFEYEKKELTVAQAAAWLAGARAGADYTTSLTYKTVTGATKVVGEKTNEEAIEAIQKGETFFSVSDNGGVMLEYDTNSLVTFNDDTPPQSNKNRPLTVYDTWCNDCLSTFIPGRYDNNSEGHTVIEGLGKAMLKQYEEDGAITNVDLDNDFKVDAEKPIDDSVYIVAGLQAVDSADKYYITTIAR